MHSIPYSTAQKLQQQIISGDYPAGTHLPPQRELAERLGISRASLRETLSVLETLGLVDILPGKGVLVRGPNSQGERNHRSFATPTMGALSPRHLIEMRLILEPGWTAMAAIRADARGLRQLQVLQREFQDALDRNDLITGAKADLDFHMLLARLSGNPGLEGIAYQLEHAIGHSLRLPYAWTGADDEPAREHDTVVEALMARDASAAAQAMRTHLISAARRGGVDLTTPASPPDEPLSFHLSPNPSQGALK